MDTNTRFKEILKINDHNVYLLSKYTETVALSNILKQKHIQNIAIDQERAPYNKYYHQKPCLVQLGLKNSIFLIDLLKDTKILYPLKEIFADPNVTKIFFDCPWDLYYFEQDNGISFSKIFDIQGISSLVLPVNQTISLSSLIEEESDLHSYEKDSKVQKGDWSVRPLSKKQIKYAALEVSYFLPLYESLIEKIQINKMEIFVSHFHDRILKELPEEKYNPLSICRIKGFKALSEDEKLILYRLGVVRDRIARNRNKPFFYILSNEKLLEIVQSNNNPNSIFRKIKWLKSSEMQLFKDALVDSSDELTIEVFQPRKPIHFADLSPLQQSLLIWRDETSKSLSIPKRFLLSRMEVEKLDYSSIETLFNDLWFTKLSGPIADQMTRSLQHALKINKNT